MTPTHFLTVGLSPQRLLALISEISNKQLTPPPPRCSRAVSRSRTCFEGSGLCSCVPSRSVHLLRDKWSEAKPPISQSRYSPGRATCPKTTCCHLLCFLLIADLCSTWSAALPHHWITLFRAPLLSSFLSLSLSLTSTVFCLPSPAWGHVWMWATVTGATNNTKVFPSRKIDKREKVSMVWNRFIYLLYFSISLA